MDPKEFENRIKQYAQVKKDNWTKNVKKAEPDEPILVQRGLDLIQIKGEKSNPTFGIRIIEMNIKSEPCPDCELEVKDRRTTLKLFSTPNPHWRERCNNCRLTRNPESGEFEFTDVESSIYFREKYQDSSKLQPVERKPAK
jgi:hypothetical protein